MATSAQLGAVSLLLSIIIGLPTGILAALKQNSIADYACTFIVVAGRSVPSIVMGPLLMWIFALQLGLFPTSGWGRPIHVVLPAVTLGAYYSGYIARLTRASLLQVVREDYIRRARAKGLAERAVIVGQALKNSLIFLLILVAIFAPIIAPFHFAEGSLEDNYALPGGKFLVGADFMGRDILSRTLYGAWISMSVAIVASLVSLLVGLTVGVISSYVGGRVDNIIMRIIVAETLQIPTYIFIEAFLSFIGLGVTPPTPSWGGMISEGFKGLRSYPHLIAAPAIALCLTTLAFNFLGDGLRDALDPRMRGAT